MLKEQAIMASRLLYTVYKIQASFWITWEKEDKEAMIAVFLTEFGMFTKAEIVAYVSVLIACTLLSRGRHRKDISIASKQLLLKAVSKCNYVSGKAPALLSLQNLLKT